MIPTLNSLKASHQNGMTNNQRRETNSFSEEKNQYFPSSHNQNTPLLQGGVQNPNTPIQPQAISIDKLPKDWALTITSFLSPEDNVSLLKTNHHMKTVAEDDRNWKHYLKPELLIASTPGRALELYKNPANWQDKLVPTNKVGMKYLKRQGPIFSNPLVKKFIMDGKLSIKDALALTEPSKIFGIFRNPKYKGVENSKGIEKYIDEGKLTIQEALNLSQSQALILDEVSVQKYIDKGELTTQQAIEPTFRLLLCFSSINDHRKVLGVSYLAHAFITVLAVLGIASFNFLLIATVVVVPFLFILPVLVTILALIDESLNSPYPRGSLMRKICLHLPGVQKYIDNKSISFTHLIALSEDYSVRFNPKNLSLKSVQDRIDRQQLTVLQAIAMRRIHAYWIEFKYFIMNIF